MSERYTMPVSCKAALFNPSRTKVVIVELAPGKFGLPGGHMEADETPDVAVRRELAEEIGLTDTRLIRTDFWLRPGKKLVLGFMGYIDESTKFTLQPEEVTSISWVELSQIADGSVDIGDYSSFVMRAASRAV
ncbi:NUDIX domain-containing protein [Candidatus Saccharibacteria bacterium]|nr:NUDIX domain-containing protein [Candidatus Saccharibacteria bacterium]